MNQLALMKIFTSFEEAVAWRNTLIKREGRDIEEYLQCGYPHIECRLIQSIEQYADKYANPKDFWSPSNYPNTLPTAHFLGLQEKISGYALTSWADDEKIEESATVPKFATSINFDDFNSYDYVPKKKKGSSVNSNIQRSFVILKPDAIERGLAGELMGLIDQKGMRLIHAKMFTMTYEQIAKHYAHHEGKGFWDDMVNFLMGGPSMALVYKGERACEAIRQLIGQKHPSESPPGSIRGKYAMSFPRNLIHGADSPMDADREMKIFFTSSELKEIELHDKLS